jgi:hypothetical protein
MKHLILAIMLCFTIHSLNCQSNLNQLSERKGKMEIYETYQDFKTGQLSKNESFYIDSTLRENGEWIGTYSIFPRYSENNSKIDNIWGFNDGNRIFVLDYREFFELKYEEDMLIFYGYALPEIPENNTAVIIGGALGGAIQGSIAASNAKKSSHKYYIGEYSGKKYNNKYDMLENEIKYERSTLILYRMGKKENENPIKIKLNDSISLSFIPYSYRKLELNSSFKPLKISYGDENANQKEIYLNCLSDNYVQISKITDKIEIIPVDESKGEFDSYKPKKKQRKREK